MKINSLSVKLGISLVLLLLLLLSAGYMSLKEYNRLGEAFKWILDDNYESIKISNAMLSAIIDEDKGVIQFLLGNEESGKMLINTSHQTMLKLLAEVSENITEKNEDSLVLIVQEKYYQFHGVVSQILESGHPEKTLVAYETLTHPLLRNLQMNVNELIVVNQNEIYNQSLNLSEGAVRALMPILVSIAASIAFVLILFYFLQLYLIWPIRRIVKSLRNQDADVHKIDAKISSDDEMKLLQNEINSLIERTKFK